MKQKSKFIPSLEHLINQNFYRTSFDRKEENIDVNTDERMELERILRNFGGGTGFDNFGGYGFGSRLCKCS